MNNKYVFVVGGGQYYYRPFSMFGEYTDNPEILDHPERISLVLFTGGEDISPFLYNHKVSRKTYTSPERDQYELKIFNEVFSLNLPIAGVCRGAQFLCAMAGGTLFQHVNGHSREHFCKTWDNRIINMSSTHHQMQNPPKDAKILAWAEPTLSNTFIVQDDVEVDPPPFEYECVYYPSIKAVGMQYHPEMMHPDEEGHRFAEELVNEFLLN